MLIGEETFGSSETILFVDGRLHASGCADVRRCPPLLAVPRHWALD